MGKYIILNGQVIYIKFTTNLVILFLASICGKISLMMRLIVNK